MLSEQGIFQLQQSPFGTSFRPSYKLIFPMRTCGPWEHHWVMVTSGFILLCSAKWVKDSLTLLQVLVVYSFWVLSNIPLCSYHTFIWINVWVDSDLELWWINLLWPFLHTILCGHMCSFVLGKYVEVKLPGHIVTVV